MQQQEEPLGPAVVLGIGGEHLPRPVIAHAHQLQLAPIGGGVLAGRLGRMASRLAGLVLGWQPEGVPAHGMQHVAAPPAPVAGHDIARDVVLQVSHRQARTRWVREEAQDVLLRPGRGARRRHRRRPVQSVSRPARLPARLDVGRIVSLVCHASPMGLLLLYSDGGKTKRPPGGRRWPAGLNDADWLPSLPAHGPPLKKEEPGAERKPADRSHGQRFYVGWRGSPNGASGARGAAVGGEGAGSADTDPGQRDRPLRGPQPACNSAAAALRP